MTVVVEEEEKRALRADFFMSSESVGCEGGEKIKRKVNEVKREKDLDFVEICTRVMCDVTP